MEELRYGPRLSEIVRDCPRLDPALAASNLELSGVVVLCWIRLRTPAAVLPPAAGR